MSAHPRIRAASRFALAIVLALTLMPAATAAAITPATDPSSVEAWLEPGGSTPPAALGLTLPSSSPPMVDVVIAVDDTYSMWNSGTTPMIRALAPEILSQIGSIPGADVRFGLITYMDYTGFYGYESYANQYGLESAGDYPYRLDIPVTADADAVVTAIRGMTSGFGADDPQDYARVFYESYSDPDIGWRPGAKRILLNFGDNMPHDENLCEGLFDGVLSFGGDPGRDGVKGTEDDLDFHQVLAEMRTNGVSLLQCIPWDWPVPGTPGSMTDFWGPWSESTGGRTIVADFGGLPSQVKEGVAAILGASVKGLHLSASAGYESWLEPVTPQDALLGEAVSFQETVKVPSDASPGDHSFEVYVEDERGVRFGSQSVTVHVLPPNSDPVLTVTSADVTTDEYTFANGGNVSDADGDPVSLTCDWGYVFPNGDGTWSWWAGDGPENRSVTVTATDGQGGSASVTFQAHVQNTPPEAEKIQLDKLLVKKAEALKIEVAVRIRDVRKVRWEWGDGHYTEKLIEEAMAAPQAFSSTSLDGALTALAEPAAEPVLPPDEIVYLTAEHVYEAAGVYTPKVTIYDNDGESTEQECGYVVVYDPEGGFTTGGGSIRESDGTKSTFGFVSKYLKGASVPSGNTVFQFHSGALDFKSASYDWLVVNAGGMNAQFKGTGTVNGVPGYKFMLWAGDGTGPNGQDTFRIRIWQEDAEGVETVAYDNGAAQPLAGGSIIVHKQ